ncbi:MAG: ATP-binding protein, partial [Bacilli bacterium]|nr:ATP-binding protein [Bacilli bacterium]
MADNVNFEPQYTADNIELLPEMEGIRKRPGMYIGATNSGGLHHLIWEIVDNGVDEAANGYGSKITVTLHKDGSCSVEDDGRGIPVDIHKQTGLPAVQIIFTKLHSGGKFSDKAYQTSAGLHGVGATVVNALSSWLDIQVYRGGNIYHIRFENGGHLAVPLEITGQTRKRGTLVRFLPDADLFSTTDFKWETVANHLQEEAFLLKNVTFVLIDERIKKTEEFHYEAGLAEYVSILNQNKDPIGEIVHFVDDSTHVKMEVAMQWCSKDYNENVYSYANAVRTHDGGTHETGLRTGITKAVNDWAIQNEVIRENQKLEGNDIREGLTAVVSVKMPENLSLYESQTKQKLTSPDLLPLITEFVYSNLVHYLAEHKEFAVDLIRKCQASKQAREAARKAKEAARSGKQKKVEAIIS